MKNILPVGTAFLLLFLAPAAAVQFTLPGPTQIIQAEFGLFNRPETGKPLFVPSKIVPLAEGQGYGWVMQLRTIKTKIRWKEVFTLPSAPITWSADKSQISQDRRVSVTEKEVAPQDGMIYNSWSVASGDPKGRYVIRVIVENHLERVFEFDVQ